MRLLAMGLLTRFARFPLNDQIMTWSAQAPPTDWQVVREQWNRAHTLRTVAGIGSFTLLILWALVLGQQHVRVNEEMPLRREEPLQQGETRCFTHPSPWPLSATEKLAQLLQCQVQLGKGFLADGLSPRGLKLG
ncbi:MAG: DUF1772 domain-containing protein, partial [Chloroflexales bacterium]